VIVSALLSFLGGSAFRMIWGEVAAWLNKSLDHAHEMERLGLQRELDADNHKRTMAALQQQADLRLSVVHAEQEAAVGVEEAKAFSNAMLEAFKPTGVVWVDGWNGSIRPAAATVVLLLWVWKLATAGGVMDAWDMELAGAVLGFFFADRSLGKRGK
jgi:hypothetical protein